jgi:hypothetical protein
MNVLILAAGYGTRLARDIENDESGNYGHLKGVPKALLPIGGRPLISHWVDKLKNLEKIAKIGVLCNEKFRETFEAWEKTNECKKGSNLIGRSNKKNCSQISATHLFFLNNGIFINLVIVRLHILFFLIKNFYFNLKYCRSFFGNNCSAIIAEIIIQKIYYSPLFSCYFPLFGDRISVIQTPMKMCSFERRLVFKKWFPLANHHARLAGVSMTAKV